MSKPVAIVTGAASGIGLALSKHLLGLGYRVVLADVDATAGEREVAALGTDDAVFVLSDISVYAQQAALFRRAHTWGGGRLDFFAANAGIDDRQSLYLKDQPVDANGDPLPLNLKAVEVDLEAVLQGIWLFRFWHSQTEKPASSQPARIVITSSAAGIYGGELFPQYTAAKAAIVGLTRAVGPTLLKQGIAVNAICPGVIATNLMPEHARDLFPKECLTPMETVTRAIDIFLEKDDMAGETVEISLDELYFRKKPEFAIENQKKVAALRHTFWAAAYKEEK